METRGARQRQQQLEQLRRADGALAALPWLPEALQLHVLDALVPLLAEPQPLTTGLYPIATGPGILRARRLIALALVSKSWQAHLAGHEALLRGLRLHRLLHLSFVHDWVHFILEKKKKAAHKRLPATVALPFPGSPDLHPGPAVDAAQPPPERAGDAQQGLPGAPPRGRRREALQLEVLSRHKGGKGAGAALGLPTTACVLSCRTLHAMQAPASTLRELAAELELLDRDHFVSLIVQVHCGAAAPPQQPEPQAHASPPLPSPGPPGAAVEAQAGGAAAATSTKAAEAAQLDREFARLAAPERAKRLAALVVSRQLAVEAGAAAGGVVLWLIPTCSRINRRVPYDPASPVAHLDL